MSAEDRPEPTPAPREKGPNFYVRKWVKPEDLNQHGTMFGGSLLAWIDEEAAIYAITQLGNPRLVTKFMSEVVFEASALQGDLLELALVATHFGRTSVTIRAEVRNMITDALVITIERLVFVNLGDDGTPAPHGYTEITYGRERVPQREA